MVRVTYPKHGSDGMVRMAALDSFRTRWVGSCVDLGTELMVHAMRGICTGSLLNADSGRADTSARLEDWNSVLSLYERKYDAIPTDRIIA
jgi:hypothetical protein